MAHDASSAAARSDAAPLARVAGKVLTFELAGETYGLEILRVREIVGLPEITRVPGAPELVLGVVNLRGKVVPVVDLRRKLGMTAAEATDRTVLIVVQGHAGERRLTMGLLVDQVLEVLSVGAGDVEAAPPLGGAADASLLLGVGRAAGRALFLLDVDAVLAAGGTPSAPAA